MKNYTKLILLSTSLLLTSLPTLAEVVVVINPKNTASPMSNDQIAQFFLGRSTTFMPLDQSDSAPIRADFYKKLADKELSQVKTLWSKLVFTGKGTLPKEFSSSAEVKKAIAADVNAIGYIEKSAVDSSVKVIATLL
jgi:ABC-type phosphate transport system substrate-binding protein